MRGRQRGQGKLTTEGASLARGAQQQQLQQQQQQVMVKQEASDVEEAALTWQSRRSRQLLRKTIMNRRQAKGLGDIPTASHSPVQHELTPDEIVKKEKRKDQNRRAARKCRMKKKLRQTNVEDDYKKMMENNRRLEEESSHLRAQIASLRKQLHDHVQSGQCRHIKLDNASPATATMTTSSSTSSLTSTSSSTYIPSPSSGQTVEQMKVTNEVYLQDFGEISPAQTFTDLELDTLVNLAQCARLEDLSPVDCLTIPQCDTDDNLKTYGAPELCLSSHTYPALHDRHSVSSVASDWSVQSDQSQGYGQVPTQDGYTLGVSSHVGRNLMPSTSDWDGDLRSPAGFCQQDSPMTLPEDCEMQDLEDDVFAVRHYGP